MAMGLDVRALGKAQLFWWPLGPLLRRLGVIPVERSAPQGTVGAAVRLLHSGERIWFGLTPEGTRKPVPRWKTGFWKIARAADVPILPVYFHYPEKTIGIGPLFQPSADLDADVARLRAWYRPWQGRHHGTP
jgi:1-acyl-sn-glycerol-3-phosphate acyltransferase